MKNEWTAELIKTVRSSLEGAAKALNPNMLLAKPLTSCLAYPNNPLLAFCNINVGLWHDEVYQVTSSDGFRP